MAGVVTELIQSTRDSESLPGIENFVTQIRDSVVVACKKTTEARIESWRVVCRILEYASRDDVRARVASINMVDGKKKEGRPKEATRLVIEEFVALKVAGLRTLCTWRADWKTAATAFKCAELLSQPIFNSLIQNRMADIEEFVHGERHDEEHEDDDQDTIIVPEKAAKRIVAAFMKVFINKKGHVRLNPKARIEVVQQLNPALKQMGFEIETIGKE